MKENAERVLSNFLSTEVYCGGWVPKTEVSKGERRAIEVLLMKDIWLTHQPQELATELL